MVIALHALTTHIAMVAAWQRNNLALVAKLVYFEALQEFEHGYVRFTFNVTWPTAPRNEAHKNQGTQRCHRDCLEPTKRIDCEKGETDKAEYDLDEGYQADVEDGKTC